MSTTILVILLVCVVAGAVYNVYRNKVLDERKLELDKFSVSLDERENKLSADEATVRDLEGQLREELNKQRSLDEIAAERYELIVSAAEEATGWKLSTTRCAESSTIRTFVAYKMRSEGFSYERIGKVMHRNHSTVAHLIKKMEDMLSVPNAYREELGMFNRMVEML